MKNILTTSILALAGVAFFVPAANAALNYNDGDLIVAFQGPTNSYLLNLGSITQFQSSGALANGTMQTLANISSDVGGVAATSWSLQAEDPFGIVGNDADITVWASKAESIKGTQSSPWFNASSGSLATPQQSIQSMGTAYAQGTVANNPAGSVQSNTAINSYRSYQSGGANNSFGVPYDYFVPDTTGFAVTFSNGNDSQVLDLYQINAASDGSAATLLGALQVKADGTVVFDSNISAFGSTAPIPEPGTFAFGFALIGACAMSRFRGRRQVELAA